MAATAFVRARIDEKTRAAAATVLAEMGLTVSDAVRMTLTRVALEGAFPFDISTPNRETRAAMRESRRIIKGKTSRFASVAELAANLDKKRK